MTHRIVVYKKTQLFAQLKMMNERSDLRSAVACDRDARARALTTSSVLLLKESMQAANRRKRC